MADLNAIRAGLAVLLRTVTHDGSNQINVATEFPDQIVPPLIVLGPSLPNYHPNIGTTTGVDLLILIFLYVSRANVRNAQRQINDFLSTSGVGSMSIPNAIYTDVTLGGTVDSVQITDVRDEGRYTVGATDYIGVEIELECIKRD